jgi:hypothetical protein
MREHKKTSTSWLLSKSSVPGQGFRGFADVDCFSNFLNRLFLMVQKSRLNARGYEAITREPKIGHPYRVIEALEHGDKYQSRWSA